MNKKIVAGLISISLLLGVVSVKAADEKTVKLTSDKDEIKKGEEVVITIESKELTGIEGTLSYETSDWTLSTKDSENSFTLNQETGKFALANISGEEKISATLTLKSNTSSQASSSTIKIKEITGSDKSGGSYTIEDKEVTIKFKKDSTTADNTNQTENIKTIQEKNATISNSTSFPKTGSESVFIGIVGLGILAGAAYITYKKNNY